MAKSCLVVSNTPQDSFTKNPPRRVVRDIPRSNPDWSRWLSRLFFVTCAACAIASSGCCFLVGGGSKWGGRQNYVGSYMEKQAACLRDHVWSRRAFHLRYPHCARPHARDYEAGFIAGYRDVCQGGSGEAPPLPPKKYWSYRYQTEQGVGMQSAWFEGFALGVVAAEEDGAAAFKEIQVSAELQDAMTQLNQAKLETRQKTVVRRDETDDFPPVVQPGSMIMDHPISIRNKSPFGDSTFGTGLTDSPNTNLPVSNQPVTNAPMPVQVFPAPVPVVPGKSTNTGRR